MFDISLSNTFNVDASFFFNLIRGKRRIVGVKRSGEYKALCCFKRWQKCQWGPNSFYCPFFSTIIIGLREKMTPSNNRNILSQYSTSSYPAGRQQFHGLKSVWILSGHYRKYMSGNKVYKCYHGWPGIFAIIMTAIMDDFANYDI